MRAGPVSRSAPLSTRSSGAIRRLWPTMSRATIAEPGAVTPTCTGRVRASRAGMGRPSNSAAVVCVKNASGFIRTRRDRQSASTSLRRAGPRVAPDPVLLLALGPSVGRAAGVRMPQKGRSRSPLRSRERPTPASRASPTRNGRSAHPSGSGMRAVTGRECLTARVPRWNSPQGTPLVGRSALVSEESTFLGLPHPAKFRNESACPRVAPRKHPARAQGSLFICVCVDFQKQTGLKSGIQSFGSGSPDRAARSSPRSSPAVHPVVLTVEEARCSPKSVSR